MHVGVFPQAWTWAVVNWVVSAGGTRDSQIVTPAALVNPNRELYPTQEHSVGHVLYANLYVTGGTNSIQFQFRIPTGSNTWHTFTTATPAGGYVNWNTILNAIFIPCVPQFRMHFINGGGTDATWEGAVTLYTM